MLKLRDGSVIQSSLSYKASGSVSPGKDAGIYLARVDEVVFIDDERNTTKNGKNKQVQYNVTILEGAYAGGRVFNCLDYQNTQGDGYNYREKIRRPTSKKFQGPKADSWMDSDGEFVLVAFMGKSKTAPIIIGTASHPRHNESVATKADGIRYIEECNGIELKIDKDGNYSVTNKGGPKDNDGESANENAIGACIKMNADGSCELFDGGSQRIKMTKDSEIKTEGKQINIKAEQTCTVESESQTEVKSGGITNVNGSVVNIGSGGPPVARLGDAVQVFGSDSHGDSHALMGFIIGGSSNTLVGG